MSSSHFLFQANNFSHNSWNKQRPLTGLHTLWTSVLSSLPSRLYKKIGKASVIFPVANSLLACLMWALYGITVGLFSMFIFLKSLICPRCLGNDIWGAYFVYNSNAKEFVEASWPILQIWRYSLWEFIRIAHIVSKANLPIFPFSFPIYKTMF